MKSWIWRRHSFAPCALVFAAAVTTACGQSQPKPATASVAPVPAPVSPAEPVLSPSLPGNLARIVDAYRKTIVLLESENSLDADARARAVLVGRLLYQENHQRLTTLAETLSGQLASS